MSQIFWINQNNEEIVKNMISSLFHIEDTPVILYSKLSIKLVAFSSFGHLFSER